MAWNEDDPPAGWITIRGERHCNMFLAADALTFDLLPETGRTGGPPTYVGLGLGTFLANAYEVRNYYGTLVASGAVTTDSLTLATLPLGWYKLYLRQAGTDAVYGNLIGHTAFCVVADDANLPDPPLAVRMESPNFDGAEYALKAPDWLYSSILDSPDHAVRAVAGIGPHRYSVNNADTPTAEIAAITDDLQDFAEPWYLDNPDAARPRPLFVSFPNGGVFTPEQIAGVTATVAALYPLGIEYFEGPYNEPDLSDPPAVAALMEIFYDAVKAGHADAKVMGPMTVSINGARLSSLNAFFEAGAGDFLDAISFHHYNGTNADVPLSRRTLDAFEAMLADHGLEDLERWQTEFGELITGYGVMHYVRQAQVWAMHRFALDQYGVPKERDQWFYDTAHNFWDFASFWKCGNYATGDFWLTPLVALMRVYSSEIFGKTHVFNMDFGAVENDHYIGNGFSTVGGEAVLTFLSGGRTDGSVTFELEGTDSVEVVGPFGTVTTMTGDERNRIEVPVGNEPTYIRLPAEQNAVVAPREYGASVSIWGADVDAGGTVLTRAKVINGYLENHYYQGSELSKIEFRDDQALPATVTITLDNARRIDTAIIYCPMPNEESGTLLDYDFEYQDVGDAWHIIETVDEPTQSVTAAGSWIEGQSFIDSYFSNRRIFVHEFDAVVAQAVRITVRDCTYGGTPDAVCATAFGFPGEHKIRLREVALYCRDTQVRRVLGPAT